MAEGGALMMIYTLWRQTTLGERAFSQPEGLFELDVPYLIDRKTSRALSIEISYGQRSNLLGSHDHDRF